MPDPAWYGVIIAMPDGELHTFTNSEEAVEWAEANMDEEQAEALRTTLDA